MMISLMGLYIVLHLGFIWVVCGFDLLCCIRVCPISKWEIVGGYLYMELSKSKQAQTWKLARTEAQIANKDRSLVRSPSCPGWPHRDRAG